MVSNIVDLPQILFRYGGKSISMIDKIDVSPQAICGTHPEKSGRIQLMVATIFFVTLAAPIRFYGVWQMPYVASFSVVEVALLVALLYVVGGVVIYGRLVIGPTRIIALLALPVFATVISVIWSIHPGMTFKAMAVHFEAVLGYLVVINILRGLSVREHLGLMGAFVVVLLVAAVLSYTGIPALSPQLPPDLSQSETAAFLLSYHARFSHPFIGLSNNIATVLVMVLPILVAIGWCYRSKHWYLAASFSFVALVATMSRGVFLGLMLAVGITGLLWLAVHGRFNKGIIRLFIFFLTAMVAGMTIFFYSSPSALQHLDGRFSFYNVDSRLLAYKATLGVILAHPVTGVGGGVGLGEVVSSTGLHSVHNAYLQALFWYGIPLGLVVAFVPLLLPLVTSRLCAVRGVPRIFRRGIVIALLAVAMSNLFESSWEGSMLRLLTYVLIGWCISMLHALNVDVEKERRGLR